MTEINVFLKFSGSLKTPKRAHYGALRQIFYSGRIVWPTLPCNTSLCEGVYFRTCAL